ncbi:von willebrand factor [Pseudohyphozyma bogoriensis]|nr:von willebrand factor [Pseudohyphozyma bogoriensis]
MFRRLSQQQRSTPQQQQGGGASVSRANTHSGQRQLSDFERLTISEDGGGGPPPPDYNTALRHSINGPPPGQYNAPSGPPPVSAGSPGFKADRISSCQGAEYSQCWCELEWAAAEEHGRGPDEYDVVLLVDDSPSMVDLWTETRDAVRFFVYSRILEHAELIHRGFAISHATQLMGLVQKSVQYDKDGIDVWFMNHTEVLKGVQEPGAVRELFESVEPSGSTPTGFQLDEILRPYIESVEDAKAAKTRVKPMILLVLTDGRADDPDMVKDVIIEMAQRLDDLRSPPYQLGIQFVQLGRDPDAEEFLRELDDDLKADAGVRDLVDWTPYKERLTADFLLKSLLGSVMRNLDSRSND